MGFNTGNAYLDGYLNALNSGANQWQAAEAGKAYEKSGATENYGNKGPFTSALQNQGTTVSSGLSNLLITQPANQDAVSKAGEIVNQDQSKTSTLSEQLKQLQNERAAKTQVWENGIYMGENKELAQQYDAQIADIQQQLKAEQERQVEADPVARAEAEKKALNQQMNDLWLQRGEVSSPWGVGDDKERLAQYDAQIADVQQQIKELEEIAPPFWKRAGMAVAGGTEQWASGQISGAGTLAGNIETPGSFAAEQQYQSAIKYRDSLIEDIKAAEAGTYKISDQGLENLKEQLNYYNAQLIPALEKGVGAYNTLAEDTAKEADKLSEIATQNIEGAKAGLGKGKQLAIDVISQLPQMGLDAASGGSASM